MYCNEVFEVLSVFRDFVNSKTTDASMNDIQCIKLFEDSIRIEYWSFEHDQMYEVAKEFADYAHCPYCQYESTPDDWDNCIDGKIELSVGSEIPITITVGLHSINILV